MSPSASTSQVSIPYRYDKNSPTILATAIASQVFQFLIGTIKTSLLT